MAKPSAKGSTLHIIGDKACPSCRERHRDGKGNHLILFKAEDGSTFGKCNRCGHYEPPEGDLSFTPRKERSPEELAEELAEIADYAVLPLATRRISLEAAEWFGVKVGLDPANGKEIIEHYYPRTRESETVAYNVRRLDPKGFYYRGSPAGGVEPFGFAQLAKPSIGIKKLIITEDELSAMSVFDIVQSRLKNGRWAHLRQAVISWSAGVGSAARDIAYMQEKGTLGRFEEIIYVHDNDEAGRKSADIVRQLLPDCKFVCMPLKDVNDMHMAGREQEAWGLILFEGKTKSPDGAVRVRDIRQDASKAPEWGKSYPWEGLTNLTYGQRDGEIVAIGGGTGIGKTLLAHSIAAHNITVHKEKVGVFLLEENVNMSLKNIAGKVARHAFHRPDVEWRQDLYDQACDEIENNLFLWSNKGQNDWDHIKECIRYWAVVEGVKSFFIDNMTTLTNHLSPSEQNTEIARISTEIAGMADELNVRIFIFSHLNPPGGKLSHEEGAEVREHQFTGSRALQRWSQVILGFERNKHADEEAKHFSRIRLIKDRMYGNTGIVQTKYDVPSGCLDERLDGEMEEAKGEDDTPI